ncbi:hypothetical protein ACQR1I_16455 [Bradyrhizobium sp. HKCCYLS2038]|uniref:hypothetical protein n=1 Tax=unclassified Bradyrhizobium TaxID=2631580 RepID=UPI003EBC4869
MTIKLSKIDDQNRADHHHLTSEDVCFYLWEYTSGRNYAFSETNSLISNLKKKPSQKKAAGYQYKGRAIAKCASVLGPAINPAWLDGAVLVPIPPSRVRSDPDYDDRIALICRSIKSSVKVDVRELLYQTKSLRAAHETDQRPTVEEIKASYAIDEKLTSPAPSRIGLVDDVITAGAHYRAAKEVISARFPKATIVGFFIARRVFADPFEGLDLEFQDE